MACPVTCTQTPGSSTNEEYSDEHINSLRSLLRDRLKKTYKGFLETTCYVPMKLYLSKAANEGNQSKVIEGLEATIKDFLKVENEIRYDDLFKPCHITNKDVRTLLMKGISGIGKTTAVRKFILDWSEGRTHQDITFVLPFSLAELSLVKTKKCSLQQLLEMFFPELSDIEILKCSKVLFVFDDLSKCRFNLNFRHTRQCGDPAKELSLNALLINLLRGDLLPKAQILMTTDVEHAGVIPYKYVQQNVEIHGLDDVEWEECVTRLIQDSTVAATAIIHIKSSNNLYSMRSLPVFCQIAATVLKELITNEENMELPLTLTEMYTHFLLIEMRRKANNGKAEASLTKTDAEEMLKLGKLAWCTLNKGSLTVLEEDLIKNDIAPAVAAELSYKWPAFLKEEQLTEGKIYHFSHQMIQAYLSALYKVVNYRPSKGSVLNCTLVRRKKGLSIPVKTKHDMHKKAVDKALSNKEGKFNFYLIFLLGISAGPSHKYLSCFLSECEVRSSESIVPYIRKKLLKNSSLNVHFHLIHCLNELNVSYTLNESNVQDDFTPSEWSALAKTLLTSEDQQNIFDMKEYSNPDVAFVRLLPVIKASRVLRLCECEDMSWMLLASAMRSSANNIKEIDIEDHSIKQKHLHLLSQGLKSPDCKVEILRTPYFYWDPSGDPDPLISALLTNPLHLRELKFCSSSGMTDKTVTHLKNILVHSACHLEKLTLCNTNRLTSESAKTLAEALGNSTCCLKELELNCLFNILHDNALSKGLGNLHCQIKVLSLASCSINREGLLALVSALSSNPSHLRVLDLSHNNPGLHAFQQLCSLLKESRFKLETLKLNNVELRADTSTYRMGTVMNEACRALAAALSSSNLRVLDLSINFLYDSSVELLSAGLGHPECKLECLRMAQCSITEVGAASLANALRLNPSYMQELDLSFNPVEGTGFDQLNSLVEDPAIKLEKLIVEGLGENHSIETLQQYEYSMTLDPNTASVDVQISEGEKEAWHCYKRKQPLPEKKERFKLLSQVMCQEGLTGRHFCQVEWFGRYATIGMAYEDMSRKGHFSACCPGYNKRSWAIFVTTPFPLTEALHDGVKTRLTGCTPWRVGVYLDWSAGILSFYDTTSDKAQLMYTFYAKFTKPLYLVFSISAGIRLLPPNPGPVCCHDHDPWGMMRGDKDCRGCNGSKAG